MKKFRLFSPFIFLFIFLFFVSCRKNEVKKNEMDQYLLTTEKTDNLPIGSRITLKLKHIVNDKEVPIDRSTDIHLKIFPDDSYIKILPNEYDDKGLMDVLIMKEGKISFVGLVDDKETKLEINTKKRASLDYADANESLFDLNTALFKELVWDFSSYDKEIILRLDKPVMLKFSTDWCGPCKAALPTVKKLAQEFQGRAYVIEINSDREPTVYRAVRYSFNPPIENGIPMFVMCSPSGIAPEYLSGFGGGEPVLRSFFTNYINKHQK